VKLGAPFHFVLAGSFLCACASNPSNPSNVSASGQASGSGNGGSGSQSTANSGSATSGESSSMNASGSSGASQSGTSSGSTVSSGARSGTGSTDAAASGTPSVANSDAGSDASTTHPGECIYPPTASERKAPAFKLPAPANPAGLILRFMNNCPLDLWVKASGIPAGVVELKPKQAGMDPAEQVYDWPGLGGRISAYLNSADGFNINFIEMNASKAALNVNLSNVDWVGLPVEVRGNDPSTCLTGCYMPLAHMMDGCPPQLLDATHNVCQAPKDWCANTANVNDPLCQAILPAGQGVIANDAKCHGAALGSPADIYGCAGFWGGSPYCCAEANRGYKTDVNDPGNDMTQNCNYYQEMPYSTYSKYAQTVCPFVYSFAYDDYNNQSGYTSCIKATEMDITWCPADP
jgi:hypothetical protein